MSSPPSQLDHDASWWPIVLGLFALGNLANGLWMLAAPVHWYFNLPANVPGSGPLNEHFVRDVGCVYFLIGVALAVAAFRPRLRLPVMLAATSFYLMHALVHVFDSLRGLFGPEQWGFDLVPIYGSTLLLVVLTVALARSRSQGAGE